MVNKIQDDRDFMQNLYKVRASLTPYKHILINPQNQYANDHYNVTGFAKSKAIYEVFLKQKSATV